MKKTNRYFIPISGEPWAVHKMVVNDEEKHESYGYRIDGGVEKFDFYYFVENYLSNDKIIEISKAEAVLLIV